MLYLGLPRPDEVAQDKSIGYTAVVVICTIVLAFVIAAVGAAIGFGAMGAGAGMMGGLTGGGSPAADVQFDENSPLGKLQQLGKSLEESADKMDAAEKSGDQAAQMAAAMEGLGTLLGGGRRVDPIGVERSSPSCRRRSRGCRGQAAAPRRRALPG